MNNSLTTNEQLSKVFAMYLGCEFKYDENEESNILESIAISGLVGDENRDESGEGWYGAQDCKLLLTPLSAITDEDAIEVAKIYYGDDYKKKGVGIDLIDHFRSGYQGDIIRVNLIQQYLIQKGYAVPLFIEVGHPDNGKTAIELGLAISSEELPNDKPSVATKMPNDTNPD